MESVVEKLSVRLVKRFMVLFVFFLIVDEGRLYWKL